MTPAELTDVLLSRLAELAVEVAAIAAKLDAAVEVGSYSTAAVDGPGTYGPRLSLHHAPWAPVDRWRALDVPGSLLPCECGDFEVDGVQGSAFRDVAGA